MKSSTQRPQAALFLASQAITLFGSTVVQMAVVWHVTLVTASGAWVAAFYVCSYLPQFLMSFWGGAWADRFDRKRFIILPDAAIAVVTLVMYLLMPVLNSQPALLGALLLMCALRSVGAGVQTPAVNAAVPSLAPPDQLMRYNGLNATMQAIVQFAAPAAAAALLSAHTLRAVLPVDVFTAVAGIGLTALVRIPKPKAADGTKAVSAGMREGLRYAMAARPVGVTLGVYALFIWLSVPAGYMAGLLVRRTFGDTYWYLSAVEIAGFAGMAGGGLLMSAWGGFKRRARTLAAGLAAFGALAIGLGMARWFPLYLVLMALYGVALTMVQTACTTLLQEQARRDMQGRVFGLMSSLYAGSLPLGMAVFGPLADAVPLAWVMVFSGAALLALSATVRLSRALKHA